ncbi:MAG: pilus assembly protein, partial [Conexibacter sp.]|nr:pilus assembly protein [Conexibacter sp.]
MVRARGEEGQAAVELVALLPVLALVAALAWQSVVAGQAWWMAGAAAREAAR